MKDVFREPLCLFAGSSLLNAGNSIVVIGVAKNVIRTTKVLGYSIVADCNVIFYIENWQQKSVKLTLKPALIIVESDKGVPNVSMDFM